MRRLILAAFFIAVTSAGCASTNPVSMSSETRFNLNWSDIGTYFPRVQEQACKSMVLGIRWGDGGYGTAYSAALAQAPEADALMDVAVDTRGVHVLAFDMPGSDAMFGIYARRCTIVSGIPVRLGEAE